MNKKDYELFLSSSIDEMLKKAALTHNIIIPEEVKNEIMKYAYKSFSLYQGTKISLYPSNISTILNFYENQINYLANKNSFTLSSISSSFHQKELSDLVSLDSIFGSGVKNYETILSELEYAISRCKNDIFFDAPFFTNTIVTDSNISLSEKGLFILFSYLYAESNCTITKDELIKYCSNGKTSFERAWRNLLKSGYIIQRKKRNSQGRFAYTYSFSLKKRQNSDTTPR